MYLTTALLFFAAILLRWKSDVNSFPDLDGQIDHGPAYSFEYSTREAYGKNITGWGPNDPLNATWWHLVTEGMLWPRGSSIICIADIAHVLSYL
jgi:hypothetical protein